MRSRSGHPARVALALALAGGGCNAPAPAPVVIVPEASALAPSAEPSIALPTATAAVAPPPGGEAPPPASAEAPPGAACIEVSIGLDMRALPTSTSQPGRDLFVRGQLEGFRQKATTGAPLRMFFTPGWGSFRGVFDGPTRQGELARCEKVTAAYLAKAPHLPILMTPAARVIGACHPCK